PAATAASTAFHLASGPGLRAQTTPRTAAPITAPPTSHRAQRRGRDSPTYIVPDLENPGRDDGRSAGISPPSRTHLLPPALPLLGESQARRPARGPPPGGAPGRPRRSSLRRAC